jgi:hypothetical protein
MIVRGAGNANKGDPFQARANTLREEIAISVHVDRAAWRFVLLPGFT